MAEGETGSLGSPRDEDTLGSVFDSMFGAPGIGPISAISRIGGAMGLASMGRRPSHAATASAMTFGFSQLGGFFDGLKEAGFSVHSSGPLAGPRPDISDRAVQDALAADVDRAARRSTDPVDPDEPQGVGIGDTVGDPANDPATEGAREGGFDSGREGQGGGATSSTDSTGRDSGDPGAQGLAGGGAVLVTKKMLKGPDPKGPDEGEIRMTVQEGEMVMVIPRDLVKRYGPDKFKMLNKAMIDGLKQHMSKGMMRGKVSMKRVSAL